MNNLHGVKTILLFSLILAGIHAKAVKLTQIYEALDSPAGVEILDQSYIRYYLDEDGMMRTDDVTGDPVFKKTTDSKWAVQSVNASSGIYPVAGNTCLKSDFKRENTVSYEKSGSGYIMSNDAVEGRLTMKVTGPGVFSFYAKTSCENQDGLDVLLDGDLALDDTLSGYGEDMEWVKYEITVEGPVTDDEGNPVSYDHIITFIFKKDEPMTDYNDKGNLIFVPSDGPIKPVKADYDGDTESYKDDLELYNEEYSYFWNCVWIDKVEWTPAAPELSTGLPDDHVFIDDALIYPLNNLNYFQGYQMRYTLDGSNPTAKSPLYDESEGIYIDKSCTLRGAVFTVKGSTVTPYKPETGFTEEISIKASAPEIKLDAAAAIDAPLFSITNMFKGNEIHYSMDGGSSWQTYTAPIVPVAETVIKARCVRNGVTNSDDVELEILKATAVKISASHLDGTTEPRGVFTLGETVTLTITANAAEDEIRYTAGGLKPDTTYTAPVKTQAGNTKFLAQALSLGKLPGDIAEINIYAADTEITLGPEGSLQLNDGWNLMEFPAELTGASIERLLSARRIMVMNEGVYTVPAVIESGRGYWVYQGDGFDAPAVLNGAAVTAAAYPAASGAWELAGAETARQALTSGATVWMWEDNVFKPLTDPESMKPNCGYLVLGE